MKMCYKAESNSYLVLGQLLPETCNPPSKEYIYSVTKTTEHVVLYFNIWDNLKGVTKGEPTQLPVVWDWDDEDWVF